MTESDQTAALKSAFPTEPVPERLKTRVENLTPLPPTVTSYRFKFRHALAAFAVLWIGHNVPTAIHVWQEQHSNYHIQTWSYSSTGEKILTSDFWNQGNNVYIEIPDSITIRKNHQVFTYKQKSKTLTIKSYRLRNNYYNASAIINVLAITLLRAKDTRNITVINGIPIIQRYFESGHRMITYSNSGESYTFDKSGRVLQKVTRSNTIPSSLFETKFPDVQNTIYLKGDDDESLSSLPLLSMLRVTALEILQGEHP